MPQFERQSPFHQNSYKMLEHNRARLHLRPITELIPGITDAELLREDWLAWCVDNVGCGVWAFQNLRRLLQYLQTYASSVNEMPEEVTTELDSICIIYKVCEFLHYCLPSSLPVEDLKLPPKDDDCRMLWYALKEMKLVDACCRGGEVERKATGLKVERASCQRTAEWLARSDASYAQVHLFAANACIQMLNCARYRTKSRQPIHVQSLLLLFRSNDLTLVSASTADRHRQEPGEGVCSQTHLLITASGRKENPEREIWS